MDNRRMSYGSWGAGLGLILLGLVFLGATQGNFGLNWGNMWPAFLVIPGLLALVSAFTVGQEVREGSVMGGLVLLGLGAFFYATTLGWIAWGDQSTLWPLYVLIPGVAALCAYIVGSFRRPGFLIPGVTLTVIGGTLLASTLSGWLYDEGFWRTFNADWNRIALWRDMSIWWPIALIVIGGGLLALLPMQHNANARGGLAVVGSIPFLMGFFFLATTLDLIGWEAQGWLWPIYPIVVGVGLLAGWLVSGRTATGFLVPGVIVTTVGVVFLALMAPGYERIGDWWPVFVILAGVLLLFLPRLRGAEPPGAQKGIRH